MKKKLLEKGIKQVADRKVTTYLKISTLKNFKTAYKFQPLDIPSTNSTKMDILNVSVPLYSSREGPYLPMQMLI